jgi:hypothetical protein
MEQRTNDKVYPTNRTKVYMYYYFYNRNLMVISTSFGKDFNFENVRKTAIEKD